MSKILLKEMLALHHKSMHDVMYETGITVTTLSRIANGKQNPSVAVLDKIADYLGIQTYDLFEHKYINIKCPHCGKDFKIEIEKK